MPCTEEEIDARAKRHILVKSYTDFRDARTELNIAAELVRNSCPIGLLSFAPCGYALIRRARAVREYEIASENYWEAMHESSEAQIRLRSCLGECSLEDNDS